MADRILLDIDPPHPVVVGLDISWNGTGLVILPVNGAGSDLDRPLKVATIGVAPHSDVHQYERLAKLATLIQNAVYTKPWTPVAAMIEGYAFNARGGQAHKTGELGGVVRLSLHESGLFFGVVPPTTLKSYVAGKGNVPKAVMMREVFKRWKFDAGDDNQADAFGLAKMAQSYRRPDLPRRKADVPLFDKVELFV